jgi:hypothetical protein
MTAALGIRVFWQIWDEATLPQVGEKCNRFFSSRQEGTFGSECGYKEFDGIFLSNS